MHVYMYVSMYVRALGSPLLISRRYITRAQHYVNGTDSSRPKNVACPQKLQREKKMDCAVDDMRASVCVCVGRFSHV